MSLKSLKDRVENLTKFHQVEILRILSQYKDVTLNENKNGVFVNLTNISNDVIRHIEDYLTYVSKQENQLSAIESEKQSLSNTFFKDNKEIEDKNIKYATEQL